MANDSFEQYFHERAALAERLVDEGFVIDGCGLATAALDALGAIWFHDFPEDETALDREFGGRIPPSLRMARLLRKFASGEQTARRVAVVSFAEDWQRHAPASSAPAERLLLGRIGSKGELPRAHRDVELDQLMAESPEVAESPALRTLAEEYLYPAILYRFYRCPMLHVMGRARRTHGFTVGEEVMYMPLPPEPEEHGPVKARPTSISFGPRLITRWLRATATGYTQACAEAGVRPATNLDPGEEGEERMQARWERLRL